PLVSGRRFDSRELVLGVAVIPGVALVVGGIPRDMHMGVWVGIASAFFVAVFTSLNKRHVDRADSATVTTIELGSGALFLALIAPLLTATGDATYPVPGRNDALLLVILSVVCTLLPFILSLRALRHVSAFTAQMAVNLEPIYAIVLAMVLLGEQHELDVQFYVGVAIVIGTVFLQPLLAKRNRPVAPIQE
ncbi:MAG: DMT family transporter, partial [Dokdonella sp.]